MEQPLGLLLKGNLGRYKGFIKPFMVLSNLLELGLVILV